MTTSERVGHVEKHAPLLEHGRNVVRQRGCHFGIKEVARLG